MLRPYQQRAIDQLYQWFEKNDTGNPCVVMPTGSGKSHIIAALCKNALQEWPETRILMLTHVMELISQNFEKLRQHWPNAPVGIFSAGLGKRQIGEPITFAGIQSVRTKSDQLGHVDLVVVDECHLIGHKDTGGYRTLLRELSAINPHIRIIGLTATPYRLGHGLITDGDALFDDLIEPVTIEELIHLKHLAPLRSKHTDAKLNIDGVHKRGGEYVESELQASVDTDDQNEAVVSEVIARAGDRKAWLFFCTGVKHAERVRDELTRKGVEAECITGETPKAERTKMLADFKSGKIRALTNANVLTTGFDYPDIDLIAMLRPTMSVSLYVQMAGRGMRPKSHTDHCLVLDFAGVVSMHGPITALADPKKPKGEGDGIVPAKACPECHELVHISVMTCPSCGHEFESKAKPELKLRNDDIMALENTKEMAIASWKWRKHVSRASGKEMISVSYYGRGIDERINEYFAVTHDGYAGQKSRRELAKIAKSSGADEPDLSLDLDELASKMNIGWAPTAVKYTMDGKYFRVLSREWKWK